MIITNPYEIHVSLIWYCGHTSPQKWLIFEEYAKIKLPHTAYYRFNRFETAHTHRKQPLLHLQNENLIEKTFGFFSTCWRTIHDHFLWRQKSMLLFWARINLTCYSSKNVPFLLSYHMFLGFCHNLQSFAMKLSSRTLHLKHNWRSWGLK